MQLPSKENTTPGAASSGLAADSKPRSVPNPARPYLIGLGYGYVVLCVVLAVNQVVIYAWVDHQVRKRHARFDPVDDFGFASHGVRVGMSRADVAALFADAHEQEPSFVQRSDTDLAPMGATQYSYFYRVPLLPMLSFTETVFANEGFSVAFDSYGRAIAMDYEAFERNGGFERIHIDLQTKKLSSSPTVFR